MERATARDAGLSLLALVSVGIIAWVHLEGLRWPDSRFKIAAAVDAVIVAIFAIDLVVGFVRAEDRTTWLKSRWFEIPGLVPLYAETFAFLRVAQLLRFTRLLRLLRMSMVFRRARRTIAFFYALFHHSRIGYTGVISFFVVSFLAAVVWLLERDDNPRFDSFGDSLWWAVVTTTTVGYGDITPQTTAARIVASLLMVMGIGLIAVLSSSLSSAILSLGPHEDDDEEDEEEEDAKGDEERERRHARRTAFGRAPSLAEELERLAELHARGVLTDDEFTRAKGRAIEVHPRRHHQPPPNEPGP